MDKNIIEIAELNSKILNDADSYIKKCENAYKIQMEKIVSFVKLNEEIKFILLAGPSSSGKTTTAKLLRENLENNGFNAKTISLDDFFVERDNTPLWEDGTKNYESVDAIDWKLFDKCMHNLLTTKKTIMPTYDFVTGSKSFNTSLELNDKDIIIIEGLHSLNPIIDNFISTNLSLKIYLAPIVEYLKNGETVMNGTELRFFRRLIRDVYTRGSTPQRTLEEWKGVLLGEELYIDPYKNTANFTINSSHPYEICIYKYCLKALNMSNYPSLCDKLKPFESVVILDKKLMPSDSLLQEFVH